MADHDTMDVQVEGPGGRLFGGPTIPAGHIGVGIGFGACDQGTGQRVQVVRIVRPADEMVDWLWRLHRDAAAVKETRAAQVRHDAARSGLTADAAYKLLHEGGLPPGTLFRRS